MVHVPKYSKVKNDILNNIRSGVYQPDSRIPTREELIKKYSVTRTTINQALKELVDAGILATSKRGGTIVTGRKIHLKTAIVSSAIPVVNYSPFDHEGNAMWSILLAQDHNYNFDFIEEQKLRQNLALVENYDCVIVIQPNEELLNLLPEYKDRILLVNRYMENLNFISTNHRQAVRELTEYNIGHAGNDCQIFFLDVAESRDFVSRERREGFVDACAAKGMFYRICDIAGNRYDEILECLMKLPFEKNKKIVLTSPMLNFTGAVIKMAAERNLTFNKDLFYSDFDNAHSLITTGIKTVSAIQDYAGMGRAIINALQHFGESPVKVFVPHHLELN